MAEDPKDEGRPLLPQQPQEEVTEKPAEKPAEAPAEKPAEVPAEKPAEAPVDPVPKVDGVDSPKPDVPPLEGMGEPPKEGEPEKKGEEAPKEGEEGAPKEGEEGEEVPPPEDEEKEPSVDLEALKMEEMNEGELILYKMLKGIKKEDEYDRLIAEDDFGLVSYYKYFYHQQFEEKLNAALERDHENEIKKVHKSMNAFLKTMIEDPTPYVEEVRTSMIVPFREKMAGLEALKAELTAKVIELFEDVHLLDEEKWMEILHLLFEELAYPGNKYDW